MKFPNSSFDVVNRINRPNTLNNVYLEQYFINGGSFVDPYAISSVHIFPVPQGNSQRKYLQLSSGAADFGLVKEDSFTGSGLYLFAPSGSNLVTADSFNSSHYDTAVSGSFSGIYRISTGRYGIVLRPDGEYTRNGLLSGNGASAVGSYYDLWTVKNTSTSKWQLYIREFTLHTDIFIGIAEPLMVRSKNRLNTTRLKSGSKIDLKISTELEVENKNISDDIKELFRHSVIDSAAMRIIKINEDDYNAAPFVEVSGFSDTSGSIRVDSCDTILYLFDTTNITTVSGINKIPGIYQLQVHYNLLNEIVYSDKFSFVIE